MVVWNVFLGNPLEGAFWGVAEETKAAPDIF